MSRTFRKRENYYSDINRDINNLEYVFNIIEKYGIEQFFSDKMLNKNLFLLGNWEQHIINKIFMDDKLTLKEKNVAILHKLKEYIVSEKRYKVKINADMRNWRGTAFKLTKEYSNAQSRSGKRITAAIIKNNVDLNNLDGLNDVLYFEEHNLGKIKGAIWLFD